MKLFSGFWLLVSGTCFASDHSAHHADMAHEHGEDHEELVGVVGLRLAF
jgi:hypothetical protein